MTLSGGISEITGRENDIPMVKGGCWKNGIGKSIRHYMQNGK